jgi:hypothetical protein
LIDIEGRPFVIRDLKFIICPFSEVPVRLELPQKMTNDKSQMTYDKCSSGLKLQAPSPAREGRPFLIRDLKFLICHFSEVPVRLELPQKMTNDKSQMTYDKCSSGLKLQAPSPARSFAHKPHPC